MKIRIFRDIIDIIRAKKTPKDILREWAWSFRALKWRYQLRARLRDTAWQIIYPPQGMGDILYICLLLCEYKKAHRKKIALVVTKPYFKQLAEIFALEVDEVYPSNDTPLKHHKNVLNIEAELYEKGMKWESFRANLINVMKLDENARLQMQTRPIFTLNDTSLAIKNGKSVIISPHATSCPKCAPDSFWTRLADGFLARGFGVVFNSNDRAFAAYQCRLLSIGETIALADACGHFVGFRSGLCDVLAYFSACKKIFIYPDKPHTNTTAEQYLLDATTKELWAHNEAKEYIYSEGLFEVVLDEFAGDCGGVR